ncbi:putative endonuclease lcl3 [Madurella fahalii]|uniref:Endonuclease lcl3 n=1 Tax=Madurella fahalii TaxID=1157608 RepID=A0ABQ0G0Z3_9PEZI
MCFHRRLIFGCSHFVWLGILEPCENEKAFQRGGLDVSCDVMWSHGYGTIRVPQKCPKCMTVITIDKSRLGEIKSRIKTLKNKLDYIKGIEVAKDGEWLNLKTDSGTNSGSTIEDGTAASCSLLKETTDTRDTSIDDGWDKSNSAVHSEATYVDPKLRPFKLLERIAERMAKDTDERKAALRALTDKAAEGNNVFKHEYSFAS